MGVSSSPIWVSSQYRVALPPRLFAQDLLIDGLQLLRRIFMPLGYVGVLAPGPGKPGVGAWCTNLPPLPPSHLAGCYRWSRPYWITSRPE